MKISYVEFQQNLWKALCDTHNEKSIYGLMWPELHYVKIWLKIGITRQPPEISNIKL
jgi:hypothetical protein